MTSSDQSEPAKESVIEAAVGGGVCQRQLAHNVWVHDFAERLKMRRETLANEAGLNDYNVGTYPPVPNQQITLNEKTAPWKAAAVLGAGIVFGGAGAMGAQYILSQLPETVTEERVWDFKIDSEVILPEQSDGISAP